MSAIPSTLVVHSDSPKIYLMPGDLEEAELDQEIDRPNGVEGLSIRYWREEDRTRPRPKWSARLRSLPGIWATEFRGSSWRLGWEVQLPREGKRENATKILMSGRSDFFSCLEVPTLR
jgi:hypothetical protein